MPRGGSSGMPRGSSGSAGKAREVHKDAFARLVELVSRAPKTAHEARERLVREGYAGVQADAAVERARACLLINDEAYAQAYVLARKERGYGAFRIRQDLSAKGIDVTQYEFWDEACGAEARDAEYEEALRWARGHVPSSKHPARSLHAALMRRGFGSVCAFRVLEELGLDPYREG